MFAELDLVRRIEAAEVSLTREVGESLLREAPSGVVRALGWGVGVWTPEASPFDKVIGWGLLDEAPDEPGLRDFEEEVLQRGGAVRLELATVGALRHAEALSRRGYRTVGLENVLGLALGGQVSSRMVMPGSGLEVRVAAPGEEDAWLRTVAEGFGEPDPADPSPHERFDEALLVRVFRELGAATGYRRYVALVDGALAGGASMRLAGGLAQLAGAATRASFRRRGVQAALLRTRLADAADAGCDLAVVTTEPGSRSQRNAQRAGFELLYGRIVMVRGPAAPRAA